MLKIELMSDLNDKFNSFTKTFIFCYVLFFPRKQIHINNKNQCVCIKERNYRIVQT